MTIKFFFQLYEYYEEAKTYGLEVDSFGLT